MHSSQKRLLVLVILISSRCVQSGGICSDPIIEQSSSLGNAILQSMCSCALLSSIYSSRRDASSDFQSAASPLAEAALFLE
jgi:hypothetical protein